jgi:hypothetical protein
LSDRVRSELELVKREFGDLEVDPTLGWFVIKGWKLPPGWNRQETNLLVQVPPGYPTTPPDNFYVDEDVRLASGALPGNTGYGHELAGRRWLFFSYHVEGGDWRPHAEPLRGHNMLTFLRGAQARLSELN